MRRGDERVRLEAGKLKALLALLLLRVGEARPARELIGELWESEPPGSAAKLLQVYISQLRKQLHAEGEAILATRGGAYVLEVDAESIDVSRFKRLVEDGVAVNDDPAAAAETLTSALALWRGPPLVDFRYLAFARSEADKLEKLRLVALEKRIEAELALGRHARVIGELEQLLAQEPLHEHLHALLMLALYRSGRQAEALEVYQRVRHRLVDELGLEPGRELRDLVGAILRQDETLVAAPERHPSERLTASEIAALVAAERADRAFLHWSDESGERHIFLLPARGQVTIGRKPGTDVMLSDAEVSRAHAVLESVAGQWAVEDDDSRNGTFVNGSRVVGRRRLRDRDRLCFGNTVLGFREPLDADDPESTARARDAREGVPLTETQRKVLVALCRPLRDASSATPAANRAIAEEVFLSLDAVKAHLRVLFYRFGVGELPQNEKRAQLALRVLEDGVLLPHDF